MQQNIDFGTFPDDPDADAIRTAFQKVQDNFTEVYSSLESSAVASINNTPGAGIIVNSPTGNVVVTANIACVQVSTSTLSIGQGANGGLSAVISQSNQTLVIDLPQSMSVTNINLSGYANTIGNVIGGNINTPNTVTARQLISNIATGTAPLVVTSTTQVANLNAATAGTVSTVTTAAQPNITSTGTLTSLNVIGTTTGSAFTANTGVFTGNGNGLSSLVGSNVSGTVANAAYANLSTFATTANAVAGANVSGAVAYATTANAVAAANISGTINLANYATTANAVAGANVSGTVANATYSVSSGSTTTAATVTTAAQPNITSVGTLTSLAVTGNITAGNANVTGQLISTLVTGTAPFVVTSTTQVANLNVATAGLATYATTANAVAGANVSGTVSAATTAGTVTTAAQPNITSTGTLTSLAVTGSITTNGFTVGYLEIPQNSRSADYTLVSTDTGKSIYHPGADTSARTWTIPANSSVNFATGTAINFINDTGGGNITIAITTDTMILAGNGATGSRTLSANGMATAIKMSGTRWIISGTGVT